MSNRIAARRAALAGSVLAVTTGLTTAPVVTETAEASETHVVICNAAVSTGNTKLWVHNYYNPNGYALFPGGCNTFNRNQIKVNLSEAYNWRVRSVPGAYGRLYASMWSYPASKDRYEYWLNP